MASSLIPDPFQMWREALTKLEGNVNSLVTGSMDSQELMRSVHQLSTISLGMQQAFEKAIGSYLAKVNLPSRKDVAELAEAVRRVEEKLDRLLPAGAATSPPRPARTRRPPEDGTATPPTPAAAVEPARVATAKAKPRRSPAAPGKRAATRAGRRS